MLSGRHGCQISVFKHLDSCDFAVSYVVCPTDIYLLSCTQQLMVWDLVLGDVSLMLILSSGALVTLVRTLVSC